MKESRYNHILLLENGITLFFNFYTLKLLALNKKEASDAAGILKNSSLDITNRNLKEIHELLSGNGFLIKNEVDELELLKQSYFISRISMHNLLLTIAPTLACNFSCPYCYQEKHDHTETMSHEVEKAIFELIEHRLPVKGNLHITWFGGEPLICWDRIRQMTKNIQKICSKKNADYSASVITNGYLLNKLNLTEFKTLQIKDIQVTIDGPPEIHNNRRKLHNGGETFEIILKNIKEAVKHIHVNVRMNVDSKNRDGIIDVLEILQRNELDTQVGFYLGHVLPYTDVCTNISDSCISNKTYAALGFETLVTMTKRGFSSTYTYPKALSGFCMADKINSFVISPDGNLAKCWNSIGNVTESIGNLVETNNVKQAGSWNIPNPFEDECKNCKLLPICMGGCPFIKNKTGKRDCINWKYFQDEHLLFYYYLKNKELESDILSHIDKARNAFKKIRSLL